jgi:hypothetical protein
MKLPQPPDHQTSWCTTTPPGIHVVKVHRLRKRLSRWILSGRVIGSKLQEQLDFCRFGWVGPGAGPALQIRYSSAVTAEQIRGLVASLPEDSLCFRNVVRSPWPANGRNRREAQVACALSEPRFGWIVAKTFANQGSSAICGIEADQLAAGRGWIMKSGRRIAAWTKLRARW